MTEAEGRDHDGHDHDAPAHAGDHDHGATHRHEERREVLPAAIEADVPAGGALARIVLTLLGAAAMIVGAFLSWLRGGTQPTGPTRGVDVDYTVFWNTNPGYQQGITTSAGLVIVVLGLAAIVGLAFRSGWLTRLAGALGIVAMALFAITLYRVPGLDLSVADVGIGAWVILVGAVLALAGGFVGTQPRIIATGTPIST